VSTEEGKVHLSMVGFAEKLNARYKQLSLSQFETGKTIFDTGE
jgi:hypothetical protein